MTSSITPLEIFPNSLAPLQAHRIKSLGDEPSNLTILTGQNLTTIGLDQQVFQLPLTIQEFLNRLLFIWGH